MSQHAAHGLAAYVKSQSHCCPHIDITICMLARQMGMERDIWEEVGICADAEVAELQHDTSNLIDLLHGVIPDLAFANPIIRFVPLGAGL